MTLYPPVKTMVDRQARQHAPLLAVGPEDWLRYRRHFLRWDTRFLCVLAGLSMVFNLFWIRSDYLLLRATPLLTWMLLLRVSLIALSAWTIAVVLRTDQPERFDRWSFLWAMSCTLASLLVILSRPTTYTGHMIVELVVIMTLYAIQPGHALCRLLPPLLLSAGSLGLFFTLKVAMGYVVSLSVLIAYTGANVLGWLVSFYWHRFRQEAFFTNEALEKLYRQSELGRMAAEASERTWERIIDTSPNMLFVVNREYRIIRVNQAFAERLGLGRRELLGRRCCDLLCGQAMPPPHCLLHRLVENPQPRTVEARFSPLGIDGRILAAPLFDQFGGHEATVFIVQDITEQKRSERELKATRERYWSLVENSQSVIYTIRPEGVITYVSPGFTRLLGHEPDVIVGRHFRVLVHPDDIETCTAYQHHLLAGGDPEEGIETRVRHVDGTYRWHFSRLTRCADDNEVLTHFVGNAIDITELKQSQRALCSAREMAEQANRAKSQFLAMISHEIRTPLNAIVGFSAIAGQTDDQDRLKEYVDILAHSSQLLMDLVNDILDMSRAEAGELRLEPVVFNLPEAIDLLDKQYAPLAAAKHLGFRIVKEPGLPVWVHGDPIRFRQIGANLVANGVKFTEQGEIVVVVDSLNPEDCQGDGWVRLQVRDTGCGIEAADLAVVFEPFRQLNPGTNRTHGGSGLGLAIVRRLVDLMHGRIAVSSEVGRGSCFTVELPFGPAEPLPEEKQQPVSTGPLVILVVEDTGSNRRLLRETLEGWGHRVIEAGGAMEALDLLDQNRVDCLILDIRMPQIDGFELTRRLRQLERLSHLAVTPVIAYTADTEPSLRQHCLDIGMQAVLFKPVDPNLLAATLHQCCQRSESIGSVVPKAISGGLLDDRVLAGMAYDPQKVEEYVRLLVDDLEEALQRVERAVAAEDREVLNETAHTLKGLCETLRDKRSVTLAERLQNEAAGGIIDELRPLVGELHEQCTLLIAMMRQ